MLYFKYYILAYKQHLSRFCNEPSYWIMQSNMQKRYNLSFIKKAQYYLEYVIDYLYIRPVKHHSKFLADYIRPQILNSAKVQRLMNHLHKNIDIMTADEFLEEIQIGIEDVAVNSYLKRPRL